MRRSLGLRARIGTRSAWVAAACVLLAVSAGGSQIPGRNVNMVSGTHWPGGDPFLQRQNEGSMAVSTRNPQHLLAGGNDYRTVDLALALTGGEETGDAWHGVFKSFDGGSTWTSTLLPGYPHDSSVEGLASPISGYEAGADPIVRAGTNGLLLYGGIAFDRDPHGKGAAFVARFIDLNNKENGDPVRYIDTKVVDTGTAGQFIDKPWMAVDIPRAGAATCNLQVPQGGGAATTLQAPQGNVIVTQSFKGGNVYMSYAIFLGNENTIRTKMMFARSTDCGATWNRTKLSEGYPINQGSTIAIDPATGAVYVAWRQVKNDHVPDAILIVKSVDGGQTFTKAVEVKTITPFQQASSINSIRFNAFPTMAVYAGRVYLAWSEKGVGPGGDARVVMTTSTDGVTWSPSYVAENAPDRGHHFQPSLTVAGGKLVLGYYDLREDHTYGLYTPAPGGGYTESRQPLTPPDLASNIFTPFLQDAPVLKWRHTLDVRVAEADPGAMPMFSSVRVSQYIFGSRPDSKVIAQLQFYPPNLPMFACGGLLANCRAFIGDYLDVAGQTFAPVPGSTNWTFNPSASQAPAVHEVWTDNRDVRPPADGHWENYTPVHSDAVGPMSKFDPSLPVPACVPGRTGMRNQNLYTSRLTQGLYVGSPGNAKPLGQIQRAFVVFAQNTRSVATSYRLSIASPAVGVEASFLQFGSLDHLDVTIPAKSTASRSVFVTSSNPDASVTVNITEITAPGGAPVPGGLEGTVVMNPDISNPDISNPDISNPDISNPDISNAEVHNPDISNPDISNPDISNPDISNPDISNPDISNPDISNVDVANPDILNPDISNPDISNPDISNPDISNPDISNPDISNGSVADTYWTATSNANTSSSYTVKLLKKSDPPLGFKLQLVVHRTYATPVAQDCDLKVQVHNVVIANVPNPTFASLGDLGNPDISNPSAVTVALAPGEKARITLRVVDPNKSDAVTWSAANEVVAAVVAHAANTGETQPPFAVSAPVLVFTTQPTDTETGQVIVPPVQVKALDGSGKPVTGVSVSLALGNNPGDGTLSGTTTQTTGPSGVAIFPGLAIDSAGNGYTMVASATGYFPATSALFDVSATISFERFPDGTPACASCQITSEFASRGVVFSRTPDIPADTSVTLFDSAAYDPPGGPLNHSVSSFISGTVRMAYAGLPTTVVFRARLNNDITDAAFAVTGFDAVGNPLPPGQVTRSNISTYTSPFGFLFREETITVTNPGGISAVDLEMHGFAALIDNLRLQ